MFIKPNRIKYLICGLCLTVSLFLITCGLEEVYYLPQVPQAYIRTTMNTGAIISLPTLSSTEYYYASNYKIFYRIYISSISHDGQIEEVLLSSVNPNLYNDYRIIYPNTDPTSTSSGTPANTLFSRLNYFELALNGADINKVLAINGGDITITFPTMQGNSPVMNGYPLYRSKDLISPIPDRYFRTSSDLNDPAKAIPNINADVSGLNDYQQYAYVSMYIVLAGINPETFTPIYSKPTLINIFKLP